MTAPPALTDVRKQFAIAARQAKSAKEPRKRALAIRRCDVLLDRYLARRQN